jgi:hypothetical protein
MCTGKNVVLPVTSSEMYLQLSQSLLPVVSQKISTGAHFSSADRPSTGN